MPESCPMTSVATKEWSRVTTRERSISSSLFDMVEVGKFCFLTGSDRHTTRLSFDSSSAPAEVTDGAGGA